MFSATGVATVPTRSQDPIEQEDPVTQQDPVTPQNRIEHIVPDRGVLLAGGSTEATVTVTSDFSCLEADVPRGLEVSLSPVCGQGTWTSTMTVSDIGDTEPLTEVVIRQMTDGVEVHRLVWDVQIRTFILGPSPTTTTTSTTTPPLGSEPSDPPATSGPDTTVTVPPPDATPPSSPTVEDPVAAAFERAGIAFNTPASLGLGEVTSVELILGLGESGADVEGSVSAPGDIESADIATTCETTAQLQGLNFSVLAKTPESQYVCAGRPGVWVWDVTGKKAGTHHLTLTISAQLDDNPPVLVDVYERTIVIEVSWLERLFGPLVKNLGVFLGAFVAALGTAGGAMAWNRFRRRSVARTPV
jgi:hypothetical protein